MPPNSPDTIAMAGMLNTALPRRLTSCDCQQAEATTTSRRCCAPGWSGSVRIATPEPCIASASSASGRPRTSSPSWPAPTASRFVPSLARATQRLALELGANWAGGTDQFPPAALDAVIIFAPSGDLVPLGLRLVRKGGRVVCAGVHMSDIPSFPYVDLWGEREIVSVANLTRSDAIDFFAHPGLASLRTRVTSYRLEEANQAMNDLRRGRIRGAAVLTI
jgi:propanol-preferring alcohol dehydrogenase